MSHFFTMVIGDDHDTQLAPFHQFECTGWNDQYVQDIDITGDIKEHIRQHPDEALADVIEYFIGSCPIISTDITPDTNDACKWGYAVITDTGDLVRVVSRTNPNAQWDWYKVGGRWSGIYGEDTFRKHEVSVDYLKERITAIAKETWDKNRLPELVDALEMNYDTYIKQAVTNNLVPWAFIKDGEWHSKGDMGWWGLTKNEMLDEKWSELFWSMFEALPDDTLITIVDCHI